LKSSFIQYANRGKQSETFIEQVIDCYNSLGHTIIQKIPVPITITKGGGFSYKRKSTVDFIGFAYKRGVAFEVKKTEFTTRFPLSNISQHQYQFLKKCYLQDQYAFLLVEFEHLEEWYVVPFTMLERWWNLKDRKSIPYEAFLTEAISVSKGGKTGLDFLDFIRIEKKA